MITKTELKRIQLEQNMIKRDLDVCKVHVTHAETEVQNVEKSVNALLALYGIGVAIVAIGGSKWYLVIITIIIIIITNGTSSRGGYISHTLLWSQPFPE